MMTESGAVQTLRLLIRMPTFHVEKTLAETLESLLHQSVTNFKLVIKDVVAKPLTILRSRGELHPYPDWGVSFATVFNAGLQTPYHRKFLVIGLLSAWARLLMPHTIRRWMGRTDAKI